MVFTRRGDSLDIWRRKRDVRNVCRPSTLYNDSIQLRAGRIAWQSELSTSQDDRGAFVPWTVISPSNPTHALRAIHSKLLIASQTAGEAYIYDLPTGQFIQSVRFRGREDPLVDVNYVELGRRHAFVCTQNDVLVLPLDPADACTHLQFPTDVEGIDHVFDKKTYCLNYSDSGRPLYALSGNKKSILTPCVLSNEPPSDPFIWHPNAGKCLIIQEL